MRKAIGFVELKSIPVGIQTADEMVKAGYVTLTGRTAVSGWCEYPEGRFDKEWLDSLEVLG